MAEANIQRVPKHSEATRVEKDVQEMPKMPETAFSCVDWLQEASIQELQPTLIQVPHGEFCLNDERPFSELAPEERRLLAERIKQ